MGAEFLNEYLPSTLTGSCAIGFGLVFLAADFRSSSTRMISLGFVLMGLAILTAPYKYIYGSGPVPWNLRLLAATEAGAFIAWLQWFIMMTRAEQPSRWALRTIVTSTRIAQLLSAGYFLLALKYPESRMTFLALESFADISKDQVSLFFALAIAMYVFGLPFGLLMPFQPIGFAERYRIYSVIVAVPFLVGSLFLPIYWASISMMCGIIIFSFGALQYHVRQGQRAAFMSRFLSSEVAQAVNRDGLDPTMQPKLVELTTVCCDLRGFTRFSRKESSERVIRLLKEYYELVGREAARYKATIKDYAGDGVLILVGAPLHVEDHARKGIAMAQRIVDEVGRVLRHWTRDDAPLGIGAGVASGAVTVGAIGSSTRLEYTAVGASVNLASRLCELTSDGDVWVDQRAADLSRSGDLQPGGQIEVKGVGVVPYYAVKTDAETTSPSQKGQTLVDLNNPSEETP